MRFLFAMGMMLAPAWCQSPSYTITTVAGGGSNYPGNGGAATKAQLATPSGLAVDAAGNLYIVDNYRVVKVSGGILTTVAGLSQGYSGDGGQATQAAVNQPFGVAVDSSGNVYIADSYNNVVRKVSNGIISTFAGNGTAGNSGDGGAATSAQLATPWDVAVDNAGNVYIADLGNHLVRKVTGGTIATVAGNGGPYASALPAGGVAATSTGLSNVTSIALDAAGNLYIVAPQSFYVRKVTPNGIMTNIAGNGGDSGDTGDGGPAISAQLYLPQGVAVDSAGNVYVSDGNNVVREILANGTIQTIAGNGMQGYTGDGGPAASAELNGPAGLAVSGNQIYIADRNNGVVRALTAGSIGGGTAPTISAGGVVPLFGTSPSIQPGEWVSVFGTNLISGLVAEFWNGDYPTQLGGTTVSIDNKLAYLSYAGPLQINLEVPDDTTRGTVNVTVTTPNGSATTTVTLANQSPSWDVLGDGKHVAGIIVRPDGSGAYGSGANSYDILGPTGTSLGYKTVAAKAGDTVVLFGVGFGPTAPAVPSGQPYSGSAAAAVDSPNLTINGKPVTPFFWGVGTPGLFQFNITLPSGLGTGDQPLSATVNGASTTGNVVIALQ